jgi:hypothetical protein
MVMGNSDAGAIGIDKTKSVLSPVVAVASVTGRALSDALANALPLLEVAPGV